MKITIPCTSANLGVLFDKGGVALDAFSNVIEVNESNETKIAIEGEGVSVLPSDKTNLVCRAINRFYAETGKNEPEYIINMKNGIPLSMGLGSSAACIAGGMCAANYLEGNLVCLDDLIMMAAKMEGHGDNVCAALKGGFSFFEAGNIKRLADGGDVSFLLYIPKTGLSTIESRAVLPGSYSEKTTKIATRLEKEMVLALETGDYEKAGRLMEEDLIHQPYRKNLIPYWDAVMDASREAGAYGTALSGAGPSMISLCPSDKTESILGKVGNSIDIKYGLNIMGCEVCLNGITVENEEKT